MSPTTLRVGSVPYLVGRPLDRGLVDEPGVDLVRDVPARLVQRLRAEELDVALVSSIELFRRPGYRWMEGLGVMGRGAVDSVQVFLRRPLPEVSSLALDPSSHAAAALVRSLLGGGPHAPRFVEVLADEDPSDVGADAWLRIGDRALRETHASGALDTYNPSEAWLQLTGLPFVFAAWVVRPGVDPGPFLEAFARSRVRGRADLVESARRAALEWNLPLETCLDYLRRQCVYEAPAAEMAAALMAFRDLASGHGLAEADLEPEPISLPSAVPPR